MSSLIREKTKIQGGVLPIRKRPPLLANMKHNSDLVALLKATCDYYNFTTIDVCGRGQTKELVKARSTFIYIAIESGWSPKEAAKLVGRKRELALYHIRKYKEVLKEGEPWYDKKLASDIMSIKIIVNK